MQLERADAGIARHLSTHDTLSNKTRLGVAVSGGSDSVAVLHLLAGLAAESGWALEVATVDHGLRDAAAEEAQFVGDLCKGLGLRHETLHWQGWDGSGNLQDQARRARYTLLAGWAQTRTLQCVVLGHTLDDQAETFLMRLARGAGVDGLAAMNAQFERDGATFCRPALALERAELRGFLERHAIGWRDDPSNADPRFDRVKARQSLAHLSDIGIDPAVLAGVAANLGAARQALTHCTHNTARLICKADRGDICIRTGEYLDLPQEIRRRLLIAALDWIAPAQYPPRADALAELERAIREHRRITLRGCLTVTDTAEIRLTREFNAVKDLTAAADQVWDGRWRLHGPDTASTQATHIAALGETGLGEIDNWRECGLPRASLLASPALWRGDRLCAAPLANLTNGWQARLVPEREEFPQSTLSH